MIGDLFGNLGEQQEALKTQLDDIEISHQSQDESITLTVTASKKLTDISIDPEKIDLSDKEQLEDILLITLNEVFEIADAKAAELTQSLLNDMLPPGFGSMFGA